MSAPRGFVLVNALILVAALSAVAVLLLSRAGEGHARRLVEQDATRLRLVLDGGEAMMRTALMRDVRSFDHATDRWARTFEAPLDNSLLTIEPVDLQGRFNINWLSNPEDTAGRAAFHRLIQRVGLPVSRGEDIVRFMKINSNPSGYQNRVPPISPIGGPVLMVRQLRTMPTLPESDFLKLAPHITALPGDSRVNVNTVQKDVLGALLPEVPRGGLSKIIFDRERNPITSLEDFRSRVIAAGGMDATPAIDESRFSVSTNWVAVRLVAENGSGRSVTRFTLFERPPLPLAPRVAYRLTEQP